MSDQPICTHCGINPVSGAPNPRGKTGAHPWCVPCRNAEAERRVAARYGVDAPLKLPAHVIGPSEAAPDLQTRAEEFKQRVDEVRERLGVKL